MKTPKEDEKNPSISKTTSAIIVEEWNGTTSTKLTKTATISVSSSSSSLSIQKSSNPFIHISGKILQAFIPEGFPNSVTPDYVPFQVWDLLQGLSTYVRMMLSTQALLSAIGVGEKSATVIGATFQWFLRDLSGMIGGILFTFYQGSNLDSSAKMWRLIADFMNDLGMLMDLLSPLLPSAFLFILCLGSLSRSFTGVASGATRAALTQHFALQDNAADISAKEGSQETVATMIGMAFGMLLARITNGHAIAIWISFLSLTIFHMYGQFCAAFLSPPTPYPMYSMLTRLASNMSLIILIYVANYKAVSCLSLTTLNCERSSILLSHFFKTGQGDCIIFIVLFVF
nr:protein root UVB sensitive 3 isoform X1 [Ipomoea batatas]